MAQCKNHPDVEAVAVCTVCGEAVCGDCLAPGDGDPVCFDCSIAMTEKELGRKEVPEGPPPVQPEQRPARISPGIKALMAIGSVIVLAELVVILFMGAPKPAASGAPPALSAEKAATLATVTDSIVISQALESYRATHGRYPEQLDHIAGSLPAALRSRLDDPSTRYTVDDQGRYHLEIKGQAQHPVMVGSDLEAPVMKVKGVEP